MKKKIDFDWTVKDVNEWNDYDNKSYENYKITNKTLDSFIDRVKLEFQRYDIIFGGSNSPESGIDFSYTYALYFNNRVLNKKFKILFIYYDKKFDVSNLYNHYFDHAKKFILIEK